MTCSVISADRERLGGPGPYPVRGEDLLGEALSELSRGYLFAL